MKIMVKNITIIRKSISTSGIFYQQIHKERWSRSQVMSHWRHDRGIFQQDPSRETFNQVLQLYHETQWLSKLPDHRSVLRYNASLVNYHLVKLFFKKFQMSLFVRFMFV